MAGPQVKHPQSSMNLDAALWRSRSTYASPPGTLETYIPSNVCFMQMQEQIFHPTSGHMAPDEDMKRFVKVTSKTSSHGMLDVDFDMELGREPDMLTLEHGA